MMRWQAVSQVTSGPSSANTWCVRLAGASAEIENFAIAAWSSCRSAADPVHAMTATTTGVRMAPIRRLITP